MWWLVILIFVGSTVLSALLQKRPKDVQPAGLSDFQVPTAQEGRVIPVIYGTVLNSGPNVVWWGDLDIHKITQKSGGFLGIGAKDVTVGYKYNVGMQMALCHGFVDALVGVRVGDKDLTFGSGAGSIDTGKSYSINQSNLFGGEKKEGGIVGVLEFYFGSPTQASDAYLSSQFGATAPAYHGLCYAVLRNMYVGTSQYIKNWAFILRRCPNGLSLTGGKENINGDANPACMIYDLMSSPRFGLSVGSSRFDLTSFRAVASTLYDESMGMSMIVDTGAAADQIIGEICRHGNLVLYTDPSTGLWTLKAIRADYDIDDLLVFSDDDVLEDIEYSRPSFPDLLNEVKVEFISRADVFTTRLAQAQDLAVYSQQGVSQSETIQYHGFSNATIAQLVAQRDLKTASYPLAQVQLKVNRKGWQLRPGAPFVLNWSPEGIVGMVLRVAEIDYGALDDSNMMITIKAVEDIFSLASTAYIAPSGSAWTEPITDPAAPEAAYLTESPYHFTGDAIYMLDLVARGDKISTSVEIRRALTGVDPMTLDNIVVGVNTTEDGVFNPSGVLSADYPYNTDSIDDTGFVIAAGSRDLFRLTSVDDAGLFAGDNLLFIEGPGLNQRDPNGLSSIYAEMEDADPAHLGEWMGWKTITDNGDGTFTISGLVRGLFHTLPLDHLSGARVWFVVPGTNAIPFDHRSEFMKNLPPELQEFAIQNLPVSGTGTYPSSDDLADFNIWYTRDDTLARANRPYPPGNIQANGTPLLGCAPVNSDPGIDISGDITLAWSNRNRATIKTNDTIASQDDDDIGAAEFSLYVAVCIGDGSIRRSFGTTSDPVNLLPTVSGNSVVYTQAMHLSDLSGHPSFDVDTPIYFELLPILYDDPASSSSIFNVLGALRRTPNIHFIHTSGGGGYGLDYGGDYGGT